MHSNDLPSVPVLFFNLNKMWETQKVLKEIQKKNERDINARVFKKCFNDNVQGPVGCNKSLTVRRARKERNRK